MTSCNQGNTATICPSLLTSGFFPHHIHFPLYQDKSLPTHLRFQRFPFSHGEADDLILTTSEELALELVSFKDTILEHKPLQVFWGQAWESTGAADWPAKTFLLQSAKGSHIQVLSWVS